MGQPKHVQLSNAIALHLELARRAFGRALLAALVLAAVPALVVAVLVGSVVIFGFAFVLLALLTAAIPLAVRYINTSPVRRVATMLATDPRAVTDVAVGQSEVRSATLSFLYRDLVRAVLTTRTGETVALWLPERVAQDLDRAYAPTPGNHALRRSA